jgi:hypothetical protein
MGRLDFPSQHFELAVTSDDALGNVERAVVIFGKAKTDIDAVFGSAAANAVHLWRLRLQRVSEISNAEIHVYTAAPGSIINIGDLCADQIADSPHPSWITRNPNFGKRHQFGPVQNVYGIIEAAAGRRKDPTFTMICRIKSANSAMVYLYPFIFCGITISYTWLGGDWMLPSIVCWPLELDAARRALDHLVKSTDIYSSMVQLLFVSSSKFI